MKRIHRVALAVVAVLFLQQAMALNPKKTYDMRPEKYGMTYKEEKVPEKDGAILNAWFFEAKNKTTNWMVISSSGDGNMADNVEIASQFLSAGWNVCLYDYRGYGESSEFEIDPDIFIYPQFTFDLNAVLDYLRKSRAITKFDLYGTGIGAGLSLGVGANRAETRKIIADGPWISLELAKKKIKFIENKDVIIPFGYDKNYEPLYATDKTRPNIKGILVIVSAQDKLVNPADIKQLSGVSETYVVKNSTSNAENFTADKNTYFVKINRFLNH
jgi:pimeloyl-ACP methyl ester carboxylesterase